jgi:hypothetical protein
MITQESNTAIQQINPNVGTRSTAAFEAGLIAPNSEAYEQ